MTTNKVRDVRTYLFGEKDRIFLDANVWLSVYGQIAWARRGARVYSNAFRDILKAGCGIYIDVLVLSEFINSYARIEHKRLSSGAANFKSFRRSADFKPIATDLAQSARRILKHCRRIGTGFARVDITATLAELCLGDADFNDLMISDVCRSHGLKLVTDDSDFRGYGLEILTANPKLLSL